MNIGTLLCTLLKRFCEETQFNEPFYSPTIITVTHVFVASSSSAATKGTSNMVSQKRSFQTQKRKQFSQRITFQIFSR